MIWKIETPLKTLHVIPTFDGESGPSKKSDTFLTECTNISSWFRNPLSSDERVDHDVLEGVGRAAVELVFVP